VKHIHLPKYASIRIEDGLLLENVPFERFADTVRKILGNDLSPTQPTLYDLTLANTS
jgi:hypothetical protein